MKKVLKEWFIPAPWRNIALISWGCPDGEPILLVHGRQDSAVTFIPLLKYLPDKYYFVGFDLPGHGKSDSFPIGPILTRFHFLTAVQIVINHLKWKQFVYIGHSMGSEQGLFYNAVCPGQIKKFVLLDPDPSFRTNQIENFPFFYDHFYGDYYRNYHKNNYTDRIYNKTQALNSVMKARGLTKEQAELILSRNMVQIGEDKYRLSWSRRLRRVAPLYLGSDYYIQVFNTDPVPTLIILANNSEPVDINLPTDKFIPKFKKLVKHLIVQRVEGGHDVHFTNPERVAKLICPFLDKDFDKINSKL